MASAKIFFPTVEHINPYGKYRNILLGDKGFLSVEL